MLIGMRSYDPYQISKWIFSEGKTEDLTHNIRQITFSDWFLYELASSASVNTRMTPMNSLHGAEISLRSW
jgi:hypothetical protein